MSTKKQEFDITGMHCAACVKRVENVVTATNYRCHNEYRFWCY